MHDHDQHRRHERELREVEGELDRRQPASSSATNMPASTAKNACVPVAKTSASVIGMSVSEKECVLRRNSSSTGQRSPASTRRAAPTRRSRGRGSPRGGGSRRGTADGGRPDDGVQPPHRLNGVSLRLAARMPITVTSASHEPMRARPTRRERPGPLDAWVPPVPRPRPGRAAHCTRCRSAAVQLACPRDGPRARPCRPSTYAGPVGARRVDAGRDERLLDGLVRPQALVGAGARVGRQRAGDVELDRRAAPPPSRSARR